MAGRPTRGLRLGGELRRCFNRDGKAKKAFRTQGEAHSFIATDPRLSNTARKKMHPYECEFHGWHIGRNHVTKAKKVRRGGKP